MGSFLKRRTAVQAELNVPWQCENSSRSKAQTEPRKMQELSQELHGAQSISISLPFVRSIEF